MAKVSVGLRGWRFDEEEIFTDDEELKPLDEIPEEPRERLVRLVGLVEEPCDVCYLEHGEAEVHRCNQAEIVYGEPNGEVLLCPEHEPDLIYWFREEAVASTPATSTSATAFTSGSPRATRLRMGTPRSSTSRRTPMGSRTCRTSRTSRSASSRASRATGSTSSNSPERATTRRRTQRTN